MLTRIDRIQLAVPDAANAASGWTSLLGAEPAGEDKLRGLGARRSSYRLGRGFVEILEPDGAGPVADALAARGAHLFAAGAATPDVAALEARLRGAGIEVLCETSQLHVDSQGRDGHGLRMVISKHEERESVGAIDFLYEVTNLVSDAKSAVPRFADIFGLDGAAFVPIDSDHYGYAGTLTLFDPERLDRIEMITPSVPENTMGRFFARCGESLYMAFAESGELASIEKRALETGAGHTTVPPVEKRKGAGADTVFLHPPALGGMMLGLSRRSQAWSWSGSPERVRDDA
ncbi:MAG: hypothetical protein GY725_10285 [bacterium]|nr:hypothetical protein [bacterium]